MAWARRCPGCQRPIKKAVEYVLRRPGDAAAAEAVATARWEEVQLPIGLLIGSLMVIAFRMFVLGLPMRGDEADPLPVGEIAWSLLVDAIGASLGFAVAARLGFVCFFSYVSIGLTGAAVVMTSTAVLALIPGLGWVGGGLILPMLLIWWLVRPHPNDVVSLVLLVWGTMVTVRVVALFFLPAFSNTQ